MKYVIDLSKLEFGDIILLRTNDDTCEKIRAYSKSNFSHALIYKGNKSCLESHAFGVQSLNPQRLIFSNNDDLAVFRLKDKSNVDNLEIGLTNASKKIGMGYASVREVMRSYLENLEKAKEENRQFCTRFVGQLYKESGFDIVKNSDYCSPKDIEDSDLLERKTDILKEGSEKEINLALEKSSVIDIQTESTFYFLDNIRKNTGKDIQTFDDVESYLLENPEKDETFDMLLKDTEYLNLGDIERNKNILMYNPETFLKYYGLKQCLEVSKSEIYNELVRIQNFELAIIKYKKLFEKTGLKYFESHLKCYERQLELCFERYNVFQTILSLQK